MKKFAAVLAVAIAAALPATAGAYQHTTFNVVGNERPTTGLVCQPKGINAAGRWAVQVDEQSGAVTSIVRLVGRDGSTHLGRQLCLRFRDGVSVGFVPSPFVPSPF